MSLPDQPAGGPSPRQSRGVGDAPSIGRVPRMRRDSRTPEAREAAAPPRKRSWRDFRPTLAHGLMVFLVLCGLAVAGLAIWATVVNSGKKPDAGRTAGQLSPTDEKPGRRLPSPPAADMEAQVRAFLAVRNPDDLVSMIRKNEQEPAAMVAKLAKLEEVDGQLKRVKYLFPVRSRCLQLEGVLVDFVGGRNRLALLAPDPDGTWRIDFDGFDRYVSPPWESLLTGGAAEGKVRVNVAPDSYYNGHFRDESKWVCYGMQSPDCMDLMFCYAARDSAQHKALEAVIAAPGTVESERSGRSTVRRVILGIRHHADTDKRQFEVNRIYSDEWAEGPKALDDIITEEEEAPAAEPEPEPEPKPEPASVPGQ